MVVLVLDIGEERLSLFMTKSKNSICYLICVFNDQQGLETTLQSVFLDDPLADILIVDDGSTPPITVPKAPEGFRLHLKTLEKNVGLIDALNTGLVWIMEHEYPYIARLDAGDTVNKGRLKAQYEHLETHSEIGMVGTQMRAFDEKTDKTLFHVRNPIGVKKVSQTLKVKNCLAHPSVMIRTEVFKKVGFYNPDFKHAEDYEMWRRIEDSYGVDNLIDILVNKEICAGQITAINRQGSALSKLRAQIKYFKLFDIWCWIGVTRTLISLVIPRKVLLFVRSRLSSVS